jgi:NADH-quinone oxidoreductase subunit N
LSYSELLGHLAPEIIVTITALVALGVDLLFMREEPLRNRFWVCAGFASVGCAIAGAWLMVVGQFGHGELSGMLGAMFTDDPLTRVVKVALLVLTICTMVISVEGKFTNHVGEYIALILMATVGMMLLTSAVDLLMIFLALELTSLSLYTLAAFNKHNVKSIEAALKYFLFGGMAAAFTLFGLSFVYGLAGTTNLTAIATSLGGQRALDPLLLMALVMTVIGFGFKIAAAPFHLWAPDAYEGAPTPSAALIASGSKLASFFIFAKVMLVAFKSANGSAAWQDTASGWIPVLAILAALSMALGNFAALAQPNVRRLLAYSAIAHSGYALLGILANDPRGISALIFYMITYGLTVVGAFGVVSVVEQSAGGSGMADFAGLSRREPVVSFCMMIFMLSLAGIPPLAGFFGKVYLFTAAAGGAPNLGLIWLVIFAIATSAISLYYYLQVLKQIYVAPLAAGRGEIQTPLTSKVILCALAIGVVLLGCAPGLLLTKIPSIGPSFGF